MGRTTKSKGGLTTQIPLWSPDQLAPPHDRLPEKDFKSLRYPLWTQNKSRLIETYLRLFVFITKHGTYIDGFAAPQDSEFPDLWSAKLVLEMEPKRLRDFWLCDIDTKGVQKLRRLQSKHATRTRKVRVLAGDFNQKVHEILASRRITEKTATFALLDQRTFECEWATVEVLAKYKQTTKIEIFYFLATGWIDRSLAAVRTDETVGKVARWWGDADWKNLRGMDSTERALLVARRFERLGYKSVRPYPIHSERHGGRVMYHMIHATDHPEAPALMIRAYRKVSGRPDIADTETQLDFDAYLKELQDAK